MKNSQTVNTKNIQTQQKKVANVKNDLHWCWKNEKFIQFNILRERQRPIYQTLSFDELQLIKIQTSQTLNNSKNLKINPSLTKNFDTWNVEQRSQLDLLGEIGQRVHSIGMLRMKIGYKGGKIYLDRNTAENK
jgi:hypothetical protein